MKISYLWVKDYCDFDLSPEKLADVLTYIGLPVEGMEAVRDDFCLELEVTSNRSDCLSMIGVAREIAAVTGSKLQLPDTDIVEETKAVEELATVIVEAPELCARYTARVLTDVKIAPSPNWMQQRLTTVGLRPINNVVDITNYVLMEVGQPLHTFDFWKLRAGTIVVRRATKNEEMITIDEQKHKLTTDDLVIADEKLAVALAGVMGGLDTEVSEETDTLLLESAYFDPVGVRRTSRRLGFGSESSYRFERSVDPEGVSWASQRAAHLIQKFAGAKIARGMIDVNAMKIGSRNVEVRFDRVTKVLGTSVDSATVKQILSGLDFAILEETSSAVTVTVPTFRQDVYREIDLIEEIARIHGYDKIPTSTNMPVNLTPTPKSDIIEEEMCEVLVGLGFHEVLTYSIVPPEIAEKFSPWTDGQFLSIANPMRQDQSALRRSLVPGLLRVKKDNQDSGIERTEIFEISRVYLPRKGDKLPEERTCLAILEEDGFLELKGVLTRLMEHLGLGDRWQSVTGSVSFLDLEKSARIEMRDTLVGFIGEVHANVVESFDLRRTPCVLELDVCQLVKLADPERRFARLPKFPAIERDLAIVLDESVTWEKVDKVVRAACGDLLEALEFVDLYRGKQIPAGKKSLAFRSRFRSPERTLTHKEVDELQSAVVQSLDKELSATVRTQ